MKFYRPQEKKITNIELPNKLWLFGSIFAALILIAGIIYLLRFSNVFKVKDIEISGLQGPLSDEILSELKADALKQSRISYWILGNNNILSWNEDTGSFLKSHPQLAELEINKAYLGRRISIIAKERDKYGIWCQSTQPTLLHNAADGQTADNQQPTASENTNLTDSSSTATTTIPANIVLSTGNRKCFWFDDNGVVFEESPVIESELFRRVSDSSGQDVSLGGQVLPNDMFDNLKKIFQIMEMAQLNANTVKISDLSLKEAEVDSVSAPKIFFSLNGDPEFSLSVIDALKKSGQWNKLNYVNFTVENKAYYK